LLPQEMAPLLSAYIGGFLHPLAMPAHVLALAGLAAIAGRIGGFTPIIPFSIGVAIGLGALAWGVGETPASDVLLAGAVLCGLLLASGAAATVLRGVGAPLALACGAALGLDSPPEAIRLGEAFAAVTGTACGAVAALALTALAATAIAPWRHGIALRVAGSWIAAIAILALAVRWTVPLDS
jgi:urease accessory protein